MAQSVPETGEAGARRRPFVGLAREFYEPVFNFVARQSPNREDAADITQQVFVQAYQSYDRFDPTREFAPWIYTIARRCVADFYRKRKRVPEPMEWDLADPGPDPSDVAAEREGADRLWDLAGELKPKFFQVLLLHYKEGFNLEETADVMGISLTHAKVMLFRARAALKKRLATSEFKGGILS